MKKIVVVGGIVTAALVVLLSPLGCTSSSPATAPPPYQCNGSAQQCETVTECQAALAGSCAAEYKALFTCRESGAASSNPSPAGVRLRAAASCTAACTTQLGAYDACAKAGLDAGQDAAQDSGKDAAPDTGSCLPENATCTDSASCCNNNCVGDATKKCTTPA